MRQKYVMANWKMNGSIKSICELLSVFLKFKGNCIVFPPAIYLPLVKDMLTGSNISWGAQNVFPQDFGAFTGEISTPMLLDYNCRYVLIGHSERRHVFNEDENFIAKKFHHVNDHGIIPVLCVGETLKERENGLTEKVLKQQLSSVIISDKRVFKNAIVAYEPVWAIGTGKTATSAQVEDAHNVIRSYVTSLHKEDGLQLPILYGGSVNEKNAEDLFSLPDVDGGLVGGASLDANKFVEILKCIS